MTFCYLHWYLVSPWHHRCKTCLLEELLQCCVAYYLRDPDRMSLLTTPLPQDSILPLSIDDTIVVHNHKLADCLIYKKLTYKYCVFSKYKTHYVYRYVEASLKLAPLIHNAALSTSYCRVLSTPNCVNLEKRWVEYPESCQRNNSCQNWWKY